MKITSLSVQGFRNLSPLTLYAGEGLNLIYGDNGQGKTNLCEALWLLTGQRSFRGAKDQELIALGERKEKTFVQANFFGEGRDQSLRLELYPKKQAFANEILLPSSGRLSGKLYLVVFSPTHLALVQEGPAERREFIDSTICQLKPQFQRVLSDYNRVLMQRNSLLKDVYKNPYLRDTLDVWDDHLIRLTLLIQRTRESYLDRLSPYATAIYQGISEGKEALTIAYLPKTGAKVAQEDFEQVVALAIKGAREEDIRAGMSTVGAHRDDIGFFINGNAARAFGSQGQQRSVVLALKLAECEMIAAVAEEQPVVILDDVMSELDAGRREYLLSYMNSRQVFITCCEKNLFTALQKGSLYEIKGGNLLKESHL